MVEEEKDVLTEETLINEILLELKIELEVESEQDILLLQSKIKGAVREVKQKRNYAGRYAEEYVVNDLQNYCHCCGWCNLPLHHQMVGR